jgi:hypothetical protein
VIGLKRASVLELMGDLEGALEAEVRGARIRDLQSEEVAEVSAPGVTSQPSSRGVRAESLSAAAGSADATTHAVVLVRAAGELHEAALAA